MKTKLTRQEYLCLAQEGFLPDKLRRSLSVNEHSASVVTIECSDDAADEIRDLCGDRLQEVGFDESYNPNEEGQILESLVDKLLV